jgi:hypothetical protein
VSDVAILTGRLLRSIFYAVRRNSVLGVRTTSAEPEKKQTKRKVNKMLAVKQAVKTGGVIPLLTALPYRIAVEGSDSDPSFAYDPISQLTRFASSRGYSTCQYEESVGGIFTKSRTDTKKDD